MGRGEVFPGRENMIAALLVKQDFVLMTARNKYASGATIDWTARERPRA
jgi:hypothetical protein